MKTFKILLAFLSVQILLGFNPEPLKYIRQQCLTFEPPLVAGKKYGSGFNSPGDQVFLSNKVSVKIENFINTGGSVSFNKIEVISSNPGIGNNQVASINNINLKLDFAKVGFKVQELQFEFLNKGGSTNLSINGSLPVNPGKFSAIGGTISGVNVSVFESPSGLGLVLLRGSIKEVMVGGQELFIDNLCVK